MTSEAPDPTPIPSTRRIKIEPAVMARLVELDRAAAYAASLRDSYHAGLAAGLGVALDAVVGVDADTSELVVRDD